MIIIRNSFMWVSVLTCVFIGFSLFFLSFVDYIREDMCLLLKYRHHLHHRHHQHDPDQDDNDDNYHD